ncbi:helix-turn-helix transcriptional regulator [Maribacter sp. MMG018]|nr:helix-turn-helix transcriptional regulator [Maribacter sp. MMG018]MBQ4915208.1 helix-turn-helix transcriptional regulator [Maribacter sp. MMG018]
MIEMENIVKRIEKMLDYYELSASSFADKINVPRSSISHLLKGRNKPSLEFVMKVVEAFSEVNLYWLLYGKGTFPYKETTLPDQKKPPVETKIEKTAHNKHSQKVIVLYSDGTFEEYHQKPS